MVTPEYYRRKAERCRALALGANDAEAASRWNRIAEDYEMLANAMQAEGARMAHRRFTPPCSSSHMTPTVLVRKSLQVEGYHWRVAHNGATVESGTAPTELEARNAVNLVVKCIVKPTPP